MLLLFKMRQQGNLQLYMWLTLVVLGSADLD